MKIPSRLYHYTTLDTLIKILESGKISISEQSQPFVRKRSIELWATHFGYLNDKLEIQYSSDLLFEFLESKQHLQSGFGKEQWTTKFNDSVDQHFQYYIISFSELKDNLSMWRAYGDNGNGVAIGFDLTNSYKNSSGYMSRNKLAMREEEGVFRQGGHRIALAKCKYDKDEIMKLFDERTKWYDKSTPQKTLSTDNLFEFQPAGEWLNPTFTPVLSIMNSYSWNIKHPAFAEEAEWRIAFNGAISKMFEERGPHYSSEIRVNNSKMYPYMTNGIHRKNLKEIVLGPGINTESHKKALKMFLQSYDQVNNKDVKISLSEIPYQN